ncbi:MAG: penicillin-binding protein 1C [candidate division WOR-3 bacterium]|nr:penicillin-binding protein 1C [candidate division WOR-3 bacterium]
MDRLIPKAIMLLFIVIAIYFVIPPDQKSLYPEFNSIDITDRNGILLRRVLSQDYKTSIWKNLKEISPDLIKATIIKEDKRFFAHRGVDFLALFRSMFENIRCGRVRSGGSTITMQVAKMALNNKKRTIINKLREIIYALKLELYLNKAEILEIYLNRAPYGYQTYGVEAAAQLYFRKSANQLSLSESAILSTLPKSPGLLNPLKNSTHLHKERKKVLEKLIRYKLIDTTSFLCAINEPITIDREKLIFKAPHFVDFVLENTKMEHSSSITSTIDINVQEKIEKMLFTSINGLSKYNVNQGAVVVLDTRSGEIIAMVGSKNYFDEIEGQVNGCLALRQPGSSLKPFLYILALSRGIPMSYLMNDTITEFKLSDGTIFAPRNFGNKYHRYVRAREALGSSFNVPAVYLLNKLGIENFYNLLNKLHFTSISKQPSFYGLSLSLGSGEVRLLELANAYRAIANRGLWSQYRFLRYHNDTIMGERVFSEQVACIITDVLSDNSSRIKAFGDDSPLNLPFPCAVKTGTTKNFKDNWCVGFTEKYTVGVWVGNFDGSPMNGVSGISGAAPLFRDIMIELHRDRYPGHFEKPKSIISLEVCAKTGLIPGSQCATLNEIFIPGTEPKDTCSFCKHGRERILEIQSLFERKNNGLTIIHPNDGDIFKIDPHIPYRNQSISIKVSADTNVKEIILKLNGNLICQKKEREIIYLWQPKPGKHELEALGISKIETKSTKISFTVY